MFVREIILAVACDSQHCGFLTYVDSGSDEPVQPPFKLRYPKMLFGQ